MLAEQRMELKKTSRTIGILMLVMAAIAPFGMLFVPSTLVGSGDVAELAQNVGESAGLLRLAIASSGIIFLIEIVLVGLLYRLLKPVNETWSSISAFARLAMTVLQGVNLINLVVIQVLLSGSGFLAAFEPAQLAGLALAFFKVYEVVVLIWGLSFGLHLAVSGWLVFKSGYLAKFAGVALLVASACYFIQSFGTILLPQYQSAFAIVGYFSMVELVFPIWLLVKGIKAEA